MESVSTAAMSGLDGRQVEGLERRRVVEAPVVRVGATGFLARILRLSRFGHHWLFASPWVG